MAVVNELVTKFSFTGSLDPMETFNTGLAQSITLLGGVATALTASAGAFFGWAASVLDTIDPLAQLGRETGVAVEQVQALGYAASVNGSSLDAVSASLREVSKRAGEFVQEGGGPAKEIIEKLGLSMKDAGGQIKTADVIMKDLADSMRGMSQAEKMNVLDKMGIDQSMIQMLSLTSEEIDALARKAQGLGVVTQEQADAAAAFNDSLTTLKYGMQAIQNSVAVGFAPAMTYLTDKFVGFLEANHELIEGGLKYLGEILVSVMGFMSRMSPIILGLAAAFGVAWLATGGFATVMGIVMSPVVLITAAIVALLLIVDDLITAFNGGQSVIADFFNEFLGIDIVPIMKGVVDAFMSMVDSVVALIGVLWDAWTQFSSAIVKVFTGDWSGALDDLLGAFTSLGEAIKMVFSGVFDFLANAMGQVFAGIKSAATSMLPDWALKFIGAGETPPPGAEGGQPQGGPGNLGGGHDTMDVPMVGADGSTGTPGLPGASGAPAPVMPVISPNDAVAMSTSNNSTVNNSTVEQKNDIKVYSSDPQQAGAAVNNSLQDQLRTAKTQVNRGGR